MNAKYKSFGEREKHTRRYRVLLLPFRQCVQIALPSEELHVRRARPGVVSFALLRGSVTTASLFLNPASGGGCQGTPRWLALDHPVGSVSHRLFYRSKTLSMSQIRTWHLAATLNRPVKSQWSTDWSVGRIRDSSRFISIASYSCEDRTLVQSDLPWGAPSHE